MNAPGVTQGASEAMYDAFARIAAQMCGVPVAGFSFFDAEREVFKAQIGLSLCSIPRDEGFGKYVLEHGALLEIPDATQDARVRSGALVRGEQIRFYAGLPLYSPQGDAIGTLFVMSHAPQWLTVEQKNGLRELAGVVMAAQAQVALLLSAIDVAGDVILVYRVDPATGDLVLVYMNEAYTRQTGYTREEAVGRTLTHFRHAMPDDPGMAYLRDALERGEPDQMEIVSYRKDGSTFWNQVTMHPIRDAAGAITHWISVERDVTEAVERESKLEDQQARLLLLTGAARKLFGALDARTLIARLEEAVRDLVGVGATVYALTPEGRAAVTRDLRIPARPSQFGGELVERAARTRGHVTGEDGTRAAVSVASGGHVAYVVEIHAPAGRQLCSGDLFVLDLLAEYFAVAVRNAALVQELEDRRSGILELHQTKSDLIAMLAHDFKSPLTSIVGFTELAMELGDVNENQREYLESVKRVALRLADFASDMLAVSRLERNEIELRLSDVDLRALAHDVSESFRDEREVRVSAPEDALIRADAGRLRQVLYNLVDNAVKYSPGGEPVYLGIRIEGDRAHIEIADRGIGIPAGEIAQIFGRFSRASNARKLQIQGSGLGLYLARQIVELHGGKLTASSVEGEGSTFAVDLPRAPETPPRPLAIALLDKERESRSFLAHSLRETGLRVRVHRSVQDLIDSLASEEIDRLVVDVDEMPLTAEQVARLEREQERCGFSIVAIGIGGTNLFARAASLSKPFLTQDLLAAIGTTRSRPV